MRHGLKGLHTSDFDEQPFPVLRVADGLFLAGAIPSSQGVRPACQSKPRQETGPDPIASKAFADWRIHSWWQHSTVPAVAILLTGSAASLGHTQVQEPGPEPAAHGVDRTSSTDPRGRRLRQGLSLRWLMAASGSAPWLDRTFASPSGTEPAHPQPGFRIPFPPSGSRIRIGHHRLPEIRRRNTS
jgi:hypothetical protein